MRRLRVLCAIPFLGTALGELRLSTEPQIPSKHPIGQVKEPFAKPAGRLFDVNGTVGYLTGTNAWYLNHLNDDQDVIKALNQIKETGYTIIRIWGFSDISQLPSPTASLPSPNNVYFHYLNTTGGYINYGPTGLERFDFLISQCELLGLKLVIPFVNTWSEYGGVELYASVYADPGALWYDVPEAQKVYRDYIRVLVERYKDSPAVFAWQLGNEPRCVGCDLGKLVEWARETSGFVKGLDPGHMVSLGDEGWLTEREREAGFGDKGHGYSGMNGVDWVEMMGIETLDYGTVHLWPHHWAYEYEWGVQWIQDHDEIAKKFNKPIILEEYGAAGDGQKIAPILPWQDALLESGFAADQTWQFEPADTSVTSWPGPEYAIRYGSEEWDVLARNHSLRVMARNARLGSGAEGAAIGVQYHPLV